MATVLSVTDLKKGTSAVVDEVHETGGAVVITQNGQAKAVLQDVRVYEETQRALAMLKLIAQAEADVEAGRLVPQSQVARRIRRAGR